MSSNIRKQLGCITALKENNLWPLRLHLRGDKGQYDIGDNPVTTPYLLIPDKSPGNEHFHLGGIWLTDNRNQIINTPRFSLGTQPYRINCRVQNIGASPSYGGLINFYVLNGSNHRGIKFDGFTLLQGQETTVNATWTPQNGDSAIFVHVFDAFCDAHNEAFNDSDRHVIRRNYTLPLPGPYYLTARDLVFQQNVHGGKGVTFGYPYWTDKLKIFGNATYTNGIFMHPPNNGKAHVAIRIPSGAGTFSAIVGMASQNDGTWYGAEKGAIYLVDGPTQNWTSVSLSQMLSQRAPVWQTQLDQTDNWKAKVCNINIPATAHFIVFETDSLGTHNADHLAWADARFLP